MKLPQLNPTVRATNKYLSKIVENLKAKHGGVTNEEFEQELTKITGIGWKQVKNYSNHPNPNSRLKDNAVVLKFIRQEQANDKTRNIFIFLSYFIAFTVIIIVSIWYISKPNQVENYIIHEVPPNAHSSKFVSTKFFIKIPSNGWLLRLGPQKNSKFDLNSFTCVPIPQAGIKSCSFNDVNLQLTLLLENSLIIRIGISSFQDSDIDIIREQFNAIFPDKLENFPKKNIKLDRLNFTIENESFSFLATDPTSGTNMRKFFSMTVDLK